MTSSRQSSRSDGRPAISTDDDASRREARRAFVRRAHPDVGGDPEVFRLGLAAIDAEFAASSAPPPEPPVAERLKAAAMGRGAKLAREWAKLPREVKRAYRAGRDEPDPDE